MLRCCSNGRPATGFELIVERAFCTFSRLILLYRSRKPKRTESQAPMLLYFLRYFSGEAKSQGNGDIENFLVGYK